MYKLEDDYPYTMPMISHFRDPRPWEQGGMRYGKVTVLSVTFLTDADAAARLLPKPFRLDDQPLISVYLSACEDVDWLAGHGYNLVGVDVASVFDGEVDRDVHGTYCVVMWENMTEPILGGRDHSGVAKVYADIPPMQRDGDKCLASVSHFGHPILEMSAVGLKEMSAEQRKQLETAKRDSIWMNYKYIPRAENDGADVSYAATYPSSGNCTAAWQAGDADMHFHRSSFKQNPTQHVLVNLLTELPVHEVRNTQLIVWEPMMALDRLPRRLR